EEVGRRPSAALCLRLGQGSAAGPALGFAGGAAGRGSPGSGDCRRPRQVPATDRPI
ncbi:MAG: hypothetical protein AVDCRST_MAG91-3526, partial [uncultured Sphingomonadaceae bacterium]